MEKTPREVLAQEGVAKYKSGENVKSNYETSIPPELLENQKRRRFEIFASPFKSKNIKIFA